MQISTYPPSRILLPWKKGEQYDCTAVSLVRRLVPASYLPMLAQPKSTYPLVPTANGNKAFLFEMNVLIGSPVR